MKFFYACWNYRERKWNLEGNLFSPAMRAVLVGANVIQSHFLFSASGLSLKENGFAMSAFRARMILGSGQRGVGDNVGNNVSQLAKITKLVSNWRWSKNFQLTRSRAWFCWRKCNNCRLRFCSHNFCMHTTRSCSLCLPSGTACCYIPGKIKDC